MLVFINISCLNINDIQLSMHGYLKKQRLVILKSILTLISLHLEKK